MAFNFLSGLSKPNSYLGVDIGTVSIKIAEMRQGKDRPELINYAVFETFGHLERANTALQSSTLKLFDQEISEYLKIIIKKAGFKSRQVVASLPSFSAFTTLIEIPLMSDAESQQTLKFKAKQYIPLPLSSITIDWIKVGEKKDRDGNQVQQIFLVSIPNEQITKYKNIFSIANLKLTALEVEGFSLARILTRDSDRPSLIIDIGSRSTTFIVGRNGQLQFTSQSDFAGSSLTQSIASGLGINSRRAEDLKRQKGLKGLGYGPERELSTLLLPLLDVIINEGKRVQDNYEQNYQQRVEKILLTGGGANLLDIERYFSQQFGLPVVKANPLDAVIYPDELQPLAGNLGPTLSVALGLGIKPFSS